jgi:TRAP-type mannitol/chloroaromatic compound transport system permease large subunit
MNGRLNLKLLTDAAHATAVVSSVVLMILFFVHHSLVYDFLIALEWQDSHYRVVGSIAWWKNCIFDCSNIIIFLLGVF